MASSGLRRLALIVRSAPWQGRSNRDQLDVALAAAALGVELELFFLGDGAMQLLVGRNGVVAGLPPGGKAWASLADMVPTRIFVEAGQFQDLQHAGLECLPCAEPLDHTAMRSRQDGCDRVLVL